MAYTPKTYDKYLLACSSFLERNLYNAERRTTTQKLQSLLHAIDCCHTEKNTTDENEHALTHYECRGINLIYTNTPFYLLLIEVKLERPKCAE